MRTAAFAFALMMSSAAVAGGSGSTTASQDHSTMNHTTMQTTSVAVTGDAIAEPSNANPERDARGIAVISAPALVPSGWNGVSGTAMGGPLLDPVTGAELGDEASYPACTATITDNCVQTYERGRSS